MTLRTAPQSVVMYASGRFHFFRSTSFKSQLFAHDGTPLVAV